MNQYFAQLRARGNHVIIESGCDATIGRFTLRPSSAFSRVFSVNPPQKYQERSEKDYKLSAFSSLAFPY